MNKFLFEMLERRATEQTIHDLVHRRRHDDPVLVPENGRGTNTCPPWNEQVECHFNLDVAILSTIITVEVQS